MGVRVGTQLEGGETSWGCLRSLVRRKQVDSAHVNAGKDTQLAKALTVPYLLAIGVGSTIGAGVYILVGTVGRDLSGPALTLSFLVAGIAAALSAFCYAELASRCPSAGSAYHYSYICLGEGVAWLVGWAMILEYAVGGSTVARGISPNLAMLFGGSNSLPYFIARQQIPGLDIMVDPCAAILVFVATGLLCVGIKESTVAQAIVTMINVCAMIFVIVAGGYLGFKTGWVGYGLPTGYFPFGVSGVLAGSATVFFSYIGFDAVASTAEEVKNPQRDLPLAIGLTLFISCALYMMVSVVIVGLVPYYAMDPDTPISSAFSSHGMQWAAYIIIAGATTALCATLMGSMLPQPRILMVMARDGLLPPVFSDVNRHTQVPVKSTLVTGCVAALLAFSMDVSQLAGMVSVGTLLSFIIVAISVLIIRYVPPDEVPIPSSLKESIGSVSLRYSQNTDTSKDDIHPLLGHNKASVNHPLLVQQETKCNYVRKEENRRKICGWVIMVTCLGAFILPCAASDFSLPRVLQYSLSGIGGLLLLSGLIVLTCIDQDERRHKFGHSGGFTCPFVPLLPIASIVINCYLLFNLGAETWVRVSIWLVLGVFVYVFYGRKHSTLLDAVYIPAAHADEIYRNSVNLLA